MGIQPDVLICRSDIPVGEDEIDKLSLFCDVEKRAVIPLPTVRSIYEVPLILEDAGLGDYIIERLEIPGAHRDLAEWKAMVERQQNPAGRVTIAVVGKYVELRDAYLSVKEALTHAGIHHNAGLDIRWIHAEKLEEPGGEAALLGAQGIIVPGGFGERGIEGKIIAARYARMHNIPYLGLCLGMQIMVIEFARHVLGTDTPHSTEFRPDTPHPVISLLSEQQNVKDMGGTMRLGSYPCRLVPGTKAFAAYGTTEVTERHRHRYEFNNAYREVLQEAGLTLSGLSPDGNLVEISEISGHPWMVGCQFHPEFRSRPGNPHPLFRDFVGAALRLAQTPVVTPVEATGLASLL
jgi:CTP synthase